LGDNQCSGGEEGDGKEPSRKQQHTSSDGTSNHSVWKSTSAKGENPTLGKVTGRKIGGNGPKMRVCSMCRWLEGNWLGRR